MKIIFKKKNHAIKKLNFHTIYYLSLKIKIEVTQILSGPTFTIETDTFLVSFFFFKIIFLVSSIISASNYLIYFGCKQLFLLQTLLLLLNLNFSILS